MATHNIRRPSWPLWAVLLSGLVACAPKVQDEKVIEIDEEVEVEEGEVVGDGMPEAMPSDQGVDPADGMPEEPVDEAAMAEDGEAAVDGEKEDHGCIGTAGFMWCERDGECVKPDDLAEKHGLEKTADAVKAYCESKPEE